MASARAAKKQAPPASAKTPRLGRGSATTKPPRAANGVPVALRARLLEAPHDVATRTVYADALLEAGDPRGELISLQLARGEHGKPTARERALEAQLWKGELAPLRELLDKRHSKLAGGFLGIARVLSYRDPMTRDQLDHPEWRFVRRLELTELCDYPDKCREPLELVSRIPHLESMVIDSREGLVPFAGGLAGHRLAHLEVRLQDPDDLDGLDRVVAAGAFPALRALTLANYETSADRVLAIADRLPELARVEWFYWATEPRDSTRAAKTLATLAGRFGGVDFRSQWGSGSLVPEGGTTHVRFREIDDARAAGAPAALLRRLGDVTVAADGTSRLLRAAVDALVAEGFARGPRCSVREPGEQLAG